MQEILVRSSDSPAYKIFLQDYIVYHIILGVLGTIFIGVVLVVTARAFRRILDSSLGRSPSLSRFEYTAHTIFAVTGISVILMMVVVVAANMSTAVAPHDGFAQALSEISTHRPDAQPSMLHQAVIAWAKSDDAEMPTILQDAVRDRLSWQRPKAIICSILFVLSAIFTARLWNNLINRSRADINTTGSIEKRRFTMAILGIPLSLLMIILAMVNTQAAFAPIMITLLSG